MYDSLKAEVLLSILRATDPTQNAGYMSKGVV